MREALRKLLAGHPDPYGTIGARTARVTLTARTVHEARVPGVVAYLRLSPRGDDAPAHGISAQRDAIEAWARARGLPVLLWATDRDVSGDTPERPALAEALDHVRRGTGTIVVAAKRDRLARDPVVAAVLTRAIERAGAKLETADGIGAGSGAADELVRAVVDAASAYELRRIRERTREALQAKKRRGEVVSSKTPYGFRREGKRLVPEPREQQILSFMHALRARGHSYETIATALFEAGYGTRTGSRFDQSHVAVYLRRGTDPLRAMGYGVS